jgi:hypothetical protein
MDVAMDTAAIDLWFPIGDLLPLVQDSLTRGAQHDPRYGAQPVLWLMAQGRLRYLASNALPPLLIDAFDPTSRQRVYAIGHSYHCGGRSFPADQDRHGTPVRLGSIPLLAEPGHPRFPQLLDQPRGAARIGCEWLVVHLDTDGPTRWELHPFPHPTPVATWRQVRLELFGVPGSWPGQIVTNATHHGWLLPRFTPPVAAQIVTVLAQTPDLPRPLTPVRLTNAAHIGEPGLLGADPQGFHRLGQGWPWVSPDLLPHRQLLPWDGTDQPGIDPAELPAVGQDTFTGTGALMGLDEHGNLVLRPMNPDGFDPLAQAGPPEYGTLDPDAAWQLRAVEHALRKAADNRVVLTGPAATFSAAQIEALLITAADAVCAGLESLSRHQFDPATRAYQLLVADTDHVHERGDEDEDQGHNDPPRPGGAAQGGRP